MASPYTDLPTTYFQGICGFALSGLAASFENFMYVQMTDSLLTQFVAIVYAKWHEGRRALEEVEQAYSSWPNICYAIQSVLSNFDNGLQYLSNAIMQCYLNLNQELQQLVDSKMAAISDTQRKVIQSQQNSSSDWHLRLNALASSFRACFLIFLNDTYSISFPTFPCENLRFTLVPVMYMEGYTVMFAGKGEGLQFLENISRFFQHVDITQKIAEGTSISAQDDLLLKEFLTESGELREAIEELQPNFDSVAAGLITQAKTMQALLACTSCESSDTVRLACTHWVCSQCVFGDRGWEPGVDVVCPSCSSSLSLSEIRSLLTEKVFSRTLDQPRSDNNWLCPKCQKLTLTFNFCTLECQHKVCSSCFASAVQKAEMLCVLCQSFPEKEHISRIGEMNPMCSVCFIEKPILKFPAFNCPGHCVCYDCFPQPNQCPACERLLSQDEQLSIAHSFFKCQLCQESINRKILYKGGVCGCRICERCFVDRLKQTRKISQCFGCKARFPEEAVDRHYRMFRDSTEDMKIPELEHIVHQRNVKRAPCILCGEVEKLEKVELACQHIMHTFCLAHSLASQMILLTDPSCPACKEKFDYSQISQTCAALFPKKPRCSSCNGLLTDVDENTVKCEAESIVYCRKCFAKSEPDHQDAKCVTARRKFVAEVLRKNAVKDPSCRCIAETCPKCRHVAQCPNCKTPQLNKRGAKNCKCPVCKTEFCHGCSALLSPITAHGDLWHRPQCPYSKRKMVESLADAIANIAKAEGCSECGKTEGRCAPPEDLPARGEFP